jgi:hypothetical protein
MLTWGHAFLLAPSTRQYATRGSFKAIHSTYVSGVGEVSVAFNFCRWSGVRTSWSHFMTKYVMMQWGKFSLNQMCPTFYKQWNLIFCYCRLLFIIKMRKYRRFVFIMSPFWSVEWPHWHSMTANGYTVKNSILWRRLKILILFPRKCGTKNQLIRFYFGYQY